MTKKVIELASVTKKGNKATEMLGDIIRIVDDLVPEDEKWGDCFLVYVTEEGLLTYVGQTLKECDPLKMLGMLELLKQIIISEIAGDE